MTVKVSIIVPVYNSDKYLKECIDSILNQTYKEWECLIVDDGSTDNSAKIIKTYIKGDVRFKYTYQTNKGVSVARNTGFKLASGDFINFLDGDDTFLPNKLKEQVGVFLKKNLLIFYKSALYIL